MSSLEFHTSFFIALDQVHHPLTASINFNLSVLFAGFNCYEDLFLICKAN